MASGRAHAAVAGVVGIGGVVAAMIWRPEWPVERIAAGFIAGWLVTPDADVDHATVEELWWDRIPFVGRAIGTAWQMFWLPYARTHVHRGLSHWPILGTAGRAAYIAVWVWAVAALAQVAVDWAAIWRYLWPWAFAAWCLQDGLHIVWDWTPILKEM